MSSVHRVVVLLLPPVIGYDAAIPPQVFGEALDEHGQPLYEVLLATPDGQPAATTTGYGFVPHGGPELLAGAGTVIVPGTRVGRFDVPFDDAARAAVAAIPSGARTVSICTGAFALGLAGLLDGRPATTHWKYADALAEACPSARVDEAVLWTDDGDLLTSAGLSAGVDLCLHLVRRDHGSGVANAVARHLVVPPWRDGGQAQFVDRPTPVRDAESTAAVRQQALGDLTADLSVDALARMARMSRRTFVRRFTEETGQTPGAWVSAQRLRHAQELLEGSDLPVDVVAHRAGFGSPASFRAHLRQHAGVSPLAYRRTFRGRSA